MEVTEPTPPKRLRVAIIGGGIAGLTTAYLLRKTHDISLFEKSGRLGGNAYAHRLPSGQAIDIGACVFNTYTDRNLLCLLDELGIAVSTPSAHLVAMFDLDSGRALSIDFGLRALLAQRFAVLHPRTLWSLSRLYFAARKGVRLLHRGRLAGLTVRAALELLPQVRGDTRLFFIFGLCCLSSMSYEEIMEAPAEFFFAKLDMLGYLYVPTITLTLRCAQGGTGSYVEALASHFAECITLHASIDRVIRRDSKVTIVFNDAAEQQFDKVVFACNADQSLRLLDQPTAAETRLLGAWTYKEGEVVVHRDVSSFPPRVLCQGFTFLYRQRDGKVETSVNGCCWHQPGVPDDCEYVGAQHPNYPIADEKIDLRTVLRTPIFDAVAVATIGSLRSLNGTQGAYHCGSHMGFGFHEDAISSAIEVARLLGVQWPPPRGFLSRMGQILLEWLGVVSRQRMLPPSPG